MRIDRRHAAVMPLEVQIGRRDDAVEILERRQARRAALAERHALRPLERRARADVGRERALDLGRVGRHFRPCRLVGILAGDRQRRADDSGGSRRQNPPPRDGFRTIHAPSLKIARRVTRAADRSHQFWARKLAEFWPKSPRSIAVETRHLTVNITVTIGDTEMPAKSLKIRVVSVKTAVLERPLRQGHRRMMKRLSFVVLSALVLGLGLSRVRAITHSLRAPARHALRRKPQTAPRSPVAHHANSRSPNQQTALVKQVLRDLPQRSQQEQRRRPVAASFDAAKVGHDAQVAEVAEKMIRKLRSGMMPPPDARRPEAAVLAVVRGVDGDAARSGRGAQSQSRPPSVPAPQSRRVRARGERAARARRRRQRVPAARHDQRRLRQRRRRADLLGDADGRLPARGEPHQRAGGRRSEGRRRRSSPTRCRAPARRCSTSRARRSARAAASR